MIAPSFANYGSESRFVDLLLIPTFQRLNYSTVVNYHGQREHGRDIVMAEIDTLGNIRFVAVQAKYVARIGLGRSIEDLESDCKQAFKTPFRHPVMGTTEYISSFIAVNAGSITPEAREYFFNALRPQFGNNCYLLSGDHLESIVRWAGVKQQQSVTSVLTGLRMEIEFNLTRMQLILPRLTNYVPGKSPLPAERLRTEAISRYLASPLPEQLIDNDKCMEIADKFSLINGFIQHALGSADFPARKASVGTAVGLITSIVQNCQEVMQQIKSAIEQLS